MITLPTLEAYVEHFASTSPDATAVITPSRSLSYAELWQAVASRAEALRASGKRVVTFRATPDADSVIEYLAVHYAGLVAAPLEKDFPEPLFAQVSESLSKVDIPDGTADILYTTGTTGRPKGVMISASTIVANGENLVLAHGFHPELTFLICGPLNHIGSLSKMYPTFMVGATVKIIDGLKDMNVFFDAIAEESRPVATFLVPTSIRMILQLGSRRFASLASKIEFIETGAAAIAQSDMESLCNILPNARLFNTYASTETGIIATYNFNEGNCVAGCLGKPMKNAEIRITVEGKIVCSGKTLMLGYAGDPESTAAILRDDNGKTSLFTSDLGIFDVNGCLHLRGREGDVINVGGYKVSPTEVENVALQMEEIADCVCIPAPHPLAGTVLKLLYVSQFSDYLDRRRVAMFLKERLESFKVPLLYEQVNAIKRTFNGKIDRKAYLN